MAWNRASEAPKVAPKKKPSAMRGAVAGVVTLAVAAVVAFFMLFGKDEKPKAKDEKKPAAIKEVKPAAAPKAFNKTVEKEKAAERTEPKKVNNATGDAVEKLPSHCVTSFRRKPGDKKPLFDNPVTIQLQEYVVAARDVPPPSRITDQEALNACISGVTFTGDESEQDKATKEAVAGLLLDLKRWLRDGKHANDFFEELQYRQDSEHEMTESARKGILSVAAEGDEAATKDAMKTYNKFLKEKGLPEVRIFQLRHLQKEINEENALNPQEKKEDTK